MRIRALGKACNFLAVRARDAFDQADAIMARSPRRVVRAPKIMGEVYRQILDDHGRARLVARRAAAFACNKTHLVWIALRHVFV